VIRQIGSKEIGFDQPCFIVAEIGINHNGDIDIAKELINVAKLAGCDAVKFQKRTVDVVYSAEELAKPRVNPFGATNGDLKRGLEFGYEEYKEIDRYCKAIDIMWFASCWDELSVDFIDQFNPLCYKIASASLTDDALLRHTMRKGRPILLSTGMSTEEQIEHALEVLGDVAVLYHTTSTYPTSTEEINLNALLNFPWKYDCLIGYSGHEQGIIPSVLAAYMGAVSIERHITLDKNMWGSDQAASIDPSELADMVSAIRNIPKMVGDGEKVVYESELPIIAKLRRK
jgi:N-acetylneuraminate synthase